MEFPASPARFGWLVLVAALVPGLPSCGEPSADYHQALATLVEAEREFSRSAGRLGVRDAFLAHLAEDAVLFRPGPVNAHEFLRAQSPRRGVLSWEPAFADVSSGGDLGFTTGPWEFRSDPDGEPVAHGQYLTFWRRDGDIWKAVIDHGSVNPPPERGSPVLVTPVHVDMARVSRDAEESRASLLDADRDFAALLAEGDALGRLAEHVARGVRVLRNGRAPRSGVAALREDLSRRSGPSNWTVLSGDAASSGDLGYTYGEYAYGAESAERGIYVRAWRRGPDGVWRVLVDLMTPLPAESGS